MIAKHSRSLCTYLCIVLVFGLLALGQFLSGADAQLKDPQLKICNECEPPDPTPSASTCPTVPSEGPSNAWKQNTVVTVDLDDRYTPEQRECIKQGILTWVQNNGAAGNASGVTVNFTVGTGELAPNTVVLQQAPPGATFVGDTNNFAGTDGHLQMATMAINRGVTTCDALRETAAHEFGHTLGLGDYCTPASGCPNKSDSIMTGPANGAYDAPVDGNLVNPNAIKGTAGNPLVPTPCDNKAVKNSANYNPNTVNPGATPTPPPTPTSTPTPGDGGCGTGCCDACCADPCCADPECCGDPTCGDDEWCTWVCDYVCSRVCWDWDPYTGQCTDPGPWECEYQNCRMECY